MAAPNVSVPYREFLQHCARHDQVVAGLPSIDPRLQRLLAELVMMRLFDEFQETLAGIATRLACGTAYGDGTPPVLLTAPATSTGGARVLFSQHGRPKPVNVRWSRVKFITDATKYVLDQNDHFIQACSANSLVISEMQAVRNRIAHNNANSRSAFSVVVRRHYGANVNSVSPGLLLLSPRFTPSLLHTYIASCRVIARSCSRS